MTESAEEHKPTPNFDELVSFILQQPSDPQELLTYEKIEDIRADRELRKSYAKKWFWVVIIQLVFVNVVFVLAAWKYGIDAWTIRLFITATLAEAFGIVLVITRNLFPRR